MTERNRIGIDVSRWQGLVPWQDVVDSGVEYAWIKATHGLGMQPDPEFARNWKASRGLLSRGAYHWLTDSDPVAQAERVVKTLEDAGDLGELHISIDFEEPSTQRRGEVLIVHLLRALRRVRALAGDAVVYTGAWYVVQFVAPDNAINSVISAELLDELVTYPLWHSQYPRVTLADRKACAANPPLLPKPSLPKPWRDRGVPCAAWQWDGDGGCVLPNGVDADFNSATNEGFARVLRNLPEPPATQPETPSAIRASTPAPFTEAATPLRAGSGEHTINFDDHDDNDPPSAAE